MAANYHIDASGNITKNGEAKKKKKKPSADYHIDINGNVTNLSDADIGPVKEEKKSWFQSGEFADGYQFGDLTKTILGSAGDLLEDAGAGLLGLGEKGLDALLYAAPLVAQGEYYQNGGVYQKPEIQQRNQEIFDSMKTSNAEFIAKDLYNEEEIAKAIISEPIKSTTGFDIEEASVLGPKMDSLAQSGGQLLGTAGLQMVGIPWWLTTGATSFGSEAENALNQGATYEEAGLSAAITAGAEILTEKLSGGISFGGKTLDDALTHQLATRISNKVVRNGLKIGMDFVGEGSEEVISSVFSNLGSSLYKDESIEELLTSEEAIDEYIDSFIGGGILGGVSSTGKAVKSEAKGVDYVSGLTKNEKAVFDKVYNDAIAELEADGKKLTQSEKSRLYDSTMNALERGYIDTDTIESTLGGESYDSYKAVTEQESALKKEIETLENLPKEQITVKQSERLAEARQQLKELDLETPKNRLNTEISGLVNGSRLSESYNEQARKEQKFEADLDSYTNESAKQTVKNFMEHTKSNNTNRAHDYLDFLTRISEDRGYVFDFTTTEQLQESIENGNPHGIDVDPERVEAFVSEKKKTIVINMSAKKSLNSLVGHEVVHTLEGFGEYDGLQEAVFQLAETRGEYADRLASIQRRYKGLSEDGQKKELTSDLLGDYLFTDYDFIKSLSTEKPNIFKRIYNEIKYLCKMATTGSRELRELERVKHQFEKIWRENGKTDVHDDSDVKFSIRTEAPPKETGIAYKVFYVKDGKLYPPMVANPDGADTPMGVWLDADVGASAPPSKTGRQQVKAGGKGTQGGSGSLAFRPGWHLGDLPRASQFDRVNPETGNKELFPENFVWAEVEYAKDVDYQEEAMSYGYTDNGKFRHAYAGLPRLPENGYYRYRTNPKPDTVPWIITGAMKVNRLLSDAEVNAILEKNGVAPVHRQGGDVGLDKFGFNEDGSVKYSISDSKGRQLSEGQQEFFKNSKARDDAGNLMVVYHGSQDYGFTVFDNGKSDDNMSFFFTNSEDMANSYVGDKSKLYETYLNLENPYIVDAKGHRWNQIRLGENTDAITGKVERFVDLSMAYDVEIDFALVSESLGNVSDSVEYMLENEMENLDDGEESLYSDAEKAELRQLAREIDEAYENWDEEAHLDEDGEPMSMSVYLLDHKLSTKYTTRQIAKIAKNQGHDGVIIKNVYDNGKFTDVTGIHGFGNVYIAFDSNQIKAVDNANPTKDADVRFSLSDTVEETKDLIAVHNLQGEQLIKSLELGGLPMPSVAIIKAQDGHDMYGDVTLILQKDAIDPKSSKANKIYGGDAWTPTYPTIEYKPSNAVSKKIRDKYYDLGRRFGYNEVDALYRYAENMEDSLNRDGGEAAMLERLYEDTRMMQVYLLDTGREKVKTVEKEVRTEITAAEAEMNKFMVEALGNDLIAEFEIPKGAPLTYRKDFMAKHEAEIVDAYKKLLYEQFGFTDAEVENVISNTSTKDLMKIMRDAYMYTKNNGVTVRIEQDYEATNNAIKNAASDGYKEWIDNLFKGIEEKQGIRNNVDYFTNSGGRRAWESLHWENTLENVVRAMKQHKNGEAFFGGGGIFGVSAKEYKNIAEAKADSHRLHKMSDEEYEAVRKQYTDRLSEIATRISDKSERNQFIAWDNAMECIVDAVRTSKTSAGIYKELKQYRNLTVTEKDASDIAALVSDISNMPTGYFEAKPQRAVGFDEVGVFVIPNNADVKLKQELLNRGYSIAEYDPNVEGDRKRVVNQFEQFKFSLSDAGQSTPEYGTYNVYSKDIALQQDIAPVAEPVQAQPVQDYGPLTEDQANERDTEQIEQSYFIDEDGLPVREEPYNGTYAEHVKPSDPFYEKDIWEVGRDRKVKAYMYENPEVKPFFQQEARYMLGELDNSVKGEKFYNDQLYYDTNGEMGFFGTTRQTSDDIAYLLDTFNYTYKQIAKGLRDIIEDNGKENNAISKRIEFLLDERLRNGYKDFPFGDQIPPNQEYVNLLNSKQITEYNDESWNNWLRGLSEDDINTYFRGNTEATQAVPQNEYIPSEDIAPVKEEYEAIRPEPKKQPKTVRVDNVPTVNEEVAKIMVEEPEVEKKKSRFFSKAMELVADKGFVFENLAKKTKNRNLEAKWNYIRYADGMAQDFIGNGADGVRALKDVQTEVQKAGLTEKLYEYVYHKHNIDRMSLENRYEDVPNKAVFGDSVTSEISQEAVKKLEAQYPALKRYANEIYAFNNHLRQMLVDGGVISQETADLWEEMYPHYVPIRRAGDFGLNINVPLDTGRTGVNAPVKRAVGGNQDILPLFDTMAQRAFQTYKAVAKNRFGVELKNTLGTTVETETADIDGIIEGIETQDELLKKGKRGKSSTFTVFDKGEKVTFEITDEMYDALKPTNETLAYTNKVANTISNVHRGLLTEYNPAFMARNAIKDAQDVLINSQHPAQTYKNFPKAIKEMATKGKWYAEYTKNGGEQNTYFDKETNTFAKEKSGLSKAIGLPLEAISKANNFIERLPRLAEYIASREAGRGVEESMLDAARVTTNFAAGGDLTKFLNRNGATFLNASVQGAMQQVRNVRDAKMNGLKGWTQLAAKYAVAGLPVVLLNGLMWDDDEEYEELSDYVKQNYYIVAKFGDGKFVRIPKGRTLAVIQNAMEQVANGLTGNDEVDLKSFLELAVSNLAPNNPIENNILAPIIQVANNTTWYGDDLVPTRLQDLPPGEQSDESTDSISKWLGEKMGVSPYKINYLLDQYGGALGDMFLPMLTPEAESGDDSLLGNMLAPIKSAFTADSVMNNQNVSDFYDTSDTLTTNAKKAYATDEDILSNKYFNSVKAEVGKLYGEKREIQNSDLTDAEKYYLVREVQKKIDALTKEGLGEYENVNIDGVHATVGDLQFRKTDEGWSKITEQQLEKQDDVTSDLGITPSEYWSEKQEYDYAYEYPEKYDFLKENGISVADYYELDEDARDAYTWAFNNPGKRKMSQVIAGDYVQYRKITGELNDIKADKDSSGKAISGSAKEKKIAYIDGLDLDFGQKLILIRSLYSSKEDKNTYNPHIVEYLDSRDDVSYEEMVEILEELDMKVHSDGTVTW